jgi:adenosylcobinamide-GDP ribazoletransferase
VSSVRLAFGLLTAVPVGHQPEVSHRRVGEAMVLAPLTTIPMVAVLLGAHLLVEHASAPSLVVAGLVVAAETLFTRCLHLDGLADTADGLSAGYDAKSSLRAMKAPDIGPSGVAAVALVLLLQTAALSTLLHSLAGLVLAGLAWLVSRHVLAWACRRGVPAAQLEGLGAMVAGSVSGRWLSVAAVLLVAVAVVAGAATETAWWWIVAVLGAGVAAAEWLVRRCRNRLGGITGDVLGGAVEIALTAGLVAGSLLADA